MQIILAGERLLLLHQRALWWPRQQALLVADVHLGKGMMFRQQGMAVPAGSTGNDLQRLSALVNRFNAKALWVLGDLFHAPPAASLVTQFTAWRQQLALPRLVLVKGNHDSRVQVPGAWNMESVTEATVASIQLMHKPPGSNTQAVIAGHIHPTVQLQAGRADSLRAPVFWLRGQQLLLPAFGSFTGGCNITPKPAERIFAVGPQSVVEIVARHQEFERCQSSH